MLTLRKDIRKVLLVRLASSAIQKRGHVRDMRPPFELKYIQALLHVRTSLEVRLLDNMVSRLSDAALVHLASAFQPDLVVLLNTSMEFKQALSFGQALKDRRGPLIIATGQDATAEPARYVFTGSPIDMVLRGEGEAVFLQLLDVFKHGRGVQEIPGVAVDDFTSPAVAVVTDLDTLAMPAYSFDELRRYQFYYPLSFCGRALWGHILTSRGCSYECSFCSQVIRESYGRQVRVRSAHAVVDEMEQLKKQGATVIAFDDDNFTNSPEHVRRICDEIIKRKIRIRWSAQARVDNCDPDLLKAMKDAGCVLLRFGVESGSEKIIAALRKTSRPGWIDQARKVFKDTAALGLDTAALFVIGNPGEDARDVFKSIALAQELDPDILQLHFCTPYPGSSLYNRAETGISPDKLSRLYHYAPPVKNLSLMSTQTLIQLYHRFYRQTIGRPSFIVKHMLKYGGFYLANAAVFSALLRTAGTLLLKTDEDTAPQDN